MRSSEMRRWRRMWKISRTDHLRMKKCYKNSRKRGEYLQTIKGRKEGRITGCVILRKNCVLIHDNEGKIEGRLKVKGR